MPSGREIHTVKPFVPPVLDPAVLEAMRAPPDPLDLAGPDSGYVDNADADSSSDDNDDRGARRSYY